MVVIRHPLLQRSTQIKNTPNQLNFETMTLHDLARVKVYINLISERTVRAVNSPLKGSIRTAPGTAAGSGPLTATTFCRLLRRLPPPPPPRREQQFTEVSARGLAPPRPLRAGKDHGFLVRRGAHPSSRPRYACHVGSEEKPRHCKEGKKFVSRHAAKILAAFGLKGPFFTDMTSSGCLSRLLMNPACFEEEPPAAVR